MRLLVLGLWLLTAVTPAGGAPPRDIREGSIVFVREHPREPNAGLDLWLLDTRGGRPARLVGDKGWDEAPAWSPDGSLVAFQRRLTRGLNTQPAWSPDGRELAFRRGMLIGDVCIVGADGRGLRNLTRTLRLDEREPAWRPR